MKKILLVLCSFVFLLSGCGKVSENDIVKEVKNNIKKSYLLSGDLSILNNDEVYNYDVEVSYKQDRFYKVVLTNTSNDYTQVILKNSEGVYILTPSLNKSFKFQSDWPYNNSQIYLLEALMNDIESDSKRKFKEEDGKYIFETKVNYPNNSNLKNQKIVFNKNLEIEEVKVYDANETIRMEFDIEDIDYSPTFKKNYFEVDNVMRTFGEDEAVASSSLDESIFPLFLPSGTKLSNSEKIIMDEGERIIMTFDGDKPFLLVEETANVMDEFTVIPTYGEPYMLMDTLGVMTNNSLSWTSGGIDYYLVSEVMEKDELVEIAQSISNIPTLK